MINFDFSTLQALSIPEGDVIKITKLDGSLIWEAVTARLPSEYQEVEWIGTDGNSYFVSDFTINNLDKFTLHYKYLVPNLANVYMFGANGTGSGTPRFLHRYGGLVMNKDSAGSYTLFSFLHDNAFHSYKMEFEHEGKSVVYQDGELLVENTFYNRKTYYPIGVLCNNYNQSPASYKALSGCIIAELRFVDDTTGEDVFNPVPCYRKSDNVIGMYDTVKGKFYTNQGTGRFTRGTVVGTGIINLADPTDASWQQGYRYSVSNQGVVTASNTTHLTNYIPVEKGDILMIEGISLTDDYGQFAGDANKQTLYINYASTGGSYWERSGNQVKILHDDVKFMRFTLVNISNPDAVWIYKI